MEMHKRPKDIVDEWQRLVAKDIKLYSQEDIDSGYAQNIAEWHYSLPEFMTDNAAREYYGLPTK